MIVLMDSTKAASDELAEYGVPVGQLLTPLTGYRRWCDTWAVDNGAFTVFKSKKFIRLLERNADSKDSCIFVAVPDVVGSARRTLEVWRSWRHHEVLRGWPLALVMQDGIEDFEVPWDQLSTVFIGGSTKFKESSDAMACAKAGKALGKWVHVGRVNTPERYEKWLKVADSCDGSGLARFSGMRRNLGLHVRMLNASTRRRSQRRSKQST